VRVDGACQRALAFELLNVKRVEAILRLDLDRLEQAESSAPSAEARVYVLRPQTTPRFARAAESFAHHSPETPSPNTSQEIAHD